MAKILIIGNGGSEHALCYKFKQSKHVEKVYVAPGNAGMSDCAEIVNISGNDFLSLIQFAKEKQIDLTFVGPEIPLCLGIVDAFKKEGLTIFGPSELAARLEGSKVFAKNLMEKYNIPTARHKSFDDYEEALAYLNQQKLPVVLKADGLAAGKGVIISKTLADAKENIAMMMIKNSFENAGKKIVIEEFLEGEEFSLLAFVNEEYALFMQPAQDHKRAFDNDKGLNTGGMGAYTPLTHIDNKVFQEAIDKVMKPILKAMINEGCPFTGVLYGGFMACKDKVKTIEFNVRFGDPEAEVILLALEDDLYEVIMDVLNKKDRSLTFSKDYYLGVVLASAGYPESYEKNHVIDGVKDVELVFHMGTGINNEKLVNNGGRVLFVVGKGETLLKAKENAYRNVDKIVSDNLFYRKDIGNKGL